MRHVTDTLVAGQPETSLGGQHTCADGQNSSLWEAHSSASLQTHDPGTLAGANKHPRPAGGAGFEAGQEKQAHGHWPMVFVTLLLTESLPIFASYGQNLFCLFNEVQKSADKVSQALHRVPRLLGSQLRPLNSDTDSAIPGGGICVFVGVFVFSPLQNTKPVSLVLF